MIALGVLILFGVGYAIVAGLNARRGAPQTPAPIKNPAQQPTVNAPNATEYQFTCYKGPDAPSRFRTAIDGDLKIGGWTTTDNADVHVCVRTDVTTGEALVVSLGPWCDVKRSIGCGHVGIFLAQLDPKRIDPLAFIKTSEMYGMSVYNKILAWGKNTLSYRANGMFPDGGCTEDDITETYAQQDRIVDLTSERADRESVVRSCYRTSCSDATLRCR